MLLFAIDDDPGDLRRLHGAIAEAAPGAEIRDYALGAEALLAIEGQGLRPEVVFSDIRMPAPDGLALAARLKMVLPEAKVVFVTAHAECAVEAIRLRVSGYILKPVQAERVREELAYAAPLAARAPERLTVRCFGQFDVFWKGEPLMFGRRQTKELFAYLIDREGSVCTSEEIASALWEDETDMRVLKRRIRQLIYDLKNTLSAIGMEDILVRRSGQLAILRDKVDCDYYRMRDGDVDSLNAYYGEYMAQYSWAELTSAKLHFYVE